MKNIFTLLFTMIALADLNCAAQIKTNPIPPNVAAIIKKENLSIDMWKKRAANLQALHAEESKRNAIVIATGGRPVYDPELERKSREAYSEIEKSKERIRILMANFPAKSTNSPPKNSGK